MTRNTMVEEIVRLIEYKDNSLQMLRRALQVPIQFVMLKSTILDRAVNSRTFRGVLDTGVIQEIVCNTFYR